MGQLFLIRASEVGFTGRDIFDGVVEHGGSIFLHLIRVRAKAIMVALEASKTLISVYLPASCNVAGAVEIGTVAVLVNTCWFPDSTMAKICLMDGLGQCLPVCDCKIEVFPWNYVCR